MVDYFKADHIAIDAYNSRRSLTSPTRLQIEMGPAPYDGNPFSAKILLLLNNPTYTTESEPNDHSLVFAGWPLAGLHPSVRIGFRQWYYRPLGYLINLFGAQAVSQNVALLQITPWASKSFDLNCVLPSREYQLQIAKTAKERGALIIICRSINFWKTSLGFGHNIMIAKNRLNPTISPNGLGMTEAEFKAVFYSLF